MTKNQVALKRFLDFTLGLICLILFFPIIIIALLITSLDTKSCGIFTQDRIGKNGKVFTIYKIRSMKEIVDFEHTSITTLQDPRITVFGRFIRKYKIDELPQLLNVVLGDMSIVGPRPDVPGFADKLENEDRIILTVKPGISGPAQLYFRNEEELLAKQGDPIKYNKEVIWPMKVKINKDYAENCSLRKDIYYIFKTIY